MDTLIHCFLLSLFILSMTTLAALRSLPLLATTNAIMMICVPILGAPTLSAFGYSTNVGAIFFANVMYGLALKHYKYGAEEAHCAINYILFALIVVFGSIFLLEEGHMLSPMFGTRIRIVGASFFSFWLIQSFFITLLDRYAERQLIWRVPAITIVMQALDSAVFFPCAFAGDVPMDQLVQFALIGWLGKSVVALVSIPFFIGFRQIARSDLAAGA